MSGFESPTCYCGKLGTHVVSGEGFRFRRCDGHVAVETKAGWNVQRLTPTDPPPDSAVPNPDKP